MKQVDTKAYMTALRSLTEQGHSVRDRKSVV